MLQHKKVGNQQGKHANSKNEQDKEKVRGNEEK